MLPSPDEEFDFKIALLILKFEFVKAEVMP